MNNDYCLNNDEGTTIPKAEGKPEGATVPKVRYLQEMGRCKNSMFITILVFLYVLHL